MSKASDAQDKQDDKDAREAAADAKEAKRDHAADAAAEIRAAAEAQAKAEKAEAAALKAKEEAAKHEYPRWVHHKTLPSKIIQTPDDREAGWEDTPFAEKEQPTDNQRIIGTPSAHTPPPRRPEP